MLFKNFCISSRKGGNDSADPSLFAGRIIGKKLLAECKCQAAAFNKREARSELHFRAAKAPSLALPSLSLAPPDLLSMGCSFWGGLFPAPPPPQIPPRISPRGGRRAHHLPAAWANESPRFRPRAFSPGQVAAWEPEERAAGKQISGSFPWTPLPSVRKKVG